MICHLLQVSKSQLNGNNTSPPALSVIDKVRYKNKLLSNSSDMDIAPALGCHHNDLTSVVQMLNTNKQMLLDKVQKLDKTIVEI